LTVVSNAGTAPAKAPLTLGAYAKYRKCSKNAVSKAIKRGRLKLSVVYDAAGQPKIADAAIADREWAENTDLSRAPGDVKERNARRELTAAQSPQQQATTAPAAPARTTTGAQTPAQQTLREEPETPGQPPPLDPDARWKLADASAEEKKYKALLAELEYRQKLGELVPVKDIELTMSTLFTNIRTKLLGVPGKVRAAAPHITLTDMAVIDRQLREVLEELSTMEPAAMPAPAATPAPDGDASSSAGAAA
jgi:hypothetical protein